MYAFLNLEINLMMIIFMPFQLLKIWRKRKLLRKESSLQQSDFYVILTLISFSMLSSTSNQCSEKCGTGVQSRKVFCRTTTDLIVDDSRCKAGDKPSDSRKCFEKACQLKVKLTQESVGESNKLLNVRWLPGAWGQVCFAHKCDNKNRKYFTP